MRSHLHVAASPSHLASGSAFTSIVAALCGVHCALTPALVAAIPVMALPPGVERGVAMVTVGVGLSVVMLGPARTSRPVLSFFALGAGLWLASVCGWLEPLPEAATSLVGSLVLAGALMASARMCRSNACEVCARE